MATSELIVERFYAAPTPFSDVVTLAYVGSGIAEKLSVSIYDLAGNLIWEAEEHNVLEVVWDGCNDDGRFMANGAYIYVVSASTGDCVFLDRGKVFILR